MAHHVFRRGALGGLLDWLVKEFGPVALLGHDETSGSTAIDSSGNGNDFLYEGAPTLGASGLLANDKLSVTLPGGANEGIQGSGFGYGPSSTIWCVFNATISGNRRIYNSAAAGFHIFAAQGSLFKFYNGGYISTGVNCNAGQTYVVAMMLDNAASLAWFYVNGIPVMSITHTGRTLIGSSDAAFGDLWDSAGSTEQFIGKMSVNMIVDGTTNNLQHYNAWKQVSNNLTHYWYEVLGTLSGATPATATSPALPPSSCVFHAPLWEEAGAQAIDVSGNENHGTYVGGPSLGQTSLGSDSVYSVVLNGSTQYLTSGVVPDYSTASFTASVRFTISANSDIIFSVYSSSTHYISAYTSGNNVIVRVSDGVISPYITTTNVFDSLPHDISIKWVQSTLTLSAWIDGVAFTPLVATGLAANAPTSCRFAGGVPTGSLLGSIEVPTIFNAALSDADCLALSGG